MTDTDGAAAMPIEELGIREELPLKERAMDEAPVGITISDPSEPDNPLIYVNDAFVALTGFSKAETVGRNCRFLQGEATDPGAVGAMREAIDRAEPVTVELVNYRKDGERFWNEVTIAPVRNEADEVTNYVGFQADVTARKEAEFAVERERHNLDYLLDRISGLLEAVHGDLIRATDRAGVERAVCDRVVATDAYDFCWIGTPDLSMDTLVETARAGSFDPDTLEIDLETASAHGEPIARAEVTGSIAVVDDPGTLAAVADECPWIGADLAGLAAVPLGYRETVYGVLVVYTSRADALNPREAVVLESIGRATATALNALERERIIVADTVQEVEFEIRDPESFVVELATAFESPFEFAGSVPRPGGSMRLFFTATVDPGAVAAALDDHPEVESVRSLGEGPGERLLEIDVGPGSLVSRLAERGGRTRSIRAADGVCTVLVELPVEADLRAVREALRERYPSTELTASRERERPPETKQEFIADLRDELTDRQLEAIRLAHVGGYFEPTRQVSGDELAEAMDITRPTFHQHLRAAERKLVDALFER